MALSIGILAGIAAAVSWGIADFLAKVIVDRMGKGGDIRALFWTRLAGLLPLFLLLFATGQWELFAPSILPMLLLMGSFDFIAYFSFYRGIAKGEVSVVSPISGSYSVVTVLLGFLLIGESLSAVRLLGVACVILGVALTSMDFSRLRKAGKRLSAGAADALVALFAWGVMWALVGLWVGGLGWLLPILGIRVTTFLLTSAYCARGRFRLGRGITGSLAAIILLSGLLDVGGYLLTSWAMGTEFVSIVAPLSASFPAVTVLLAVLFLREKLAPHQLLGILAILAGVVAISS